MTNENQVSGQLVRVFEFEGARHEVAIQVGENGEPWFDARHVCAVTGHADVAQTVKDHVDVEDASKRRTLTKGGHQKVLFINESGLYSLVLAGKTERCKAFKRWVTSEVLPSIRKTGSYGEPRNALVSLPPVNDRLDAIDIRMRQHELATVRLHNEICALRSTLAHVSAGVITVETRNRITALTRSVYELEYTLGDHVSIGSAKSRVQQDLREHIQWGKAGETLDNMPTHLGPRAIGFLTKRKERALKRGGGGRRGGGGVQLFAWPDDE